MQHALCWQLRGVFVHFLEMVPHAVEVVVSMSRLVCFPLEPRVDSVFYDALIVQLRPKDSHMAEALDELGPFETA